MSELKIVFSNKEAAEHFMSWLDGQGEQNYWTWMEYREQEEDGPITAIRFSYDKRKLEITTDCGRIG